MIRRHTLQCYNIMARILEFAELIFGNLFIWMGNLLDEQSHEGLMIVYPRSRIFKP